MSDVFALEKLSAARQAIVEAKTIPEAKQLLDKFTALADYAKRQRLELEVQNEIAECRIWTRRKIGVLLDMTLDHDGGRPSKNPSSVEGFSEQSTLDDLGISYAESSRLQAEAQIPSVTVAEYMEKAKSEGQEITTAGLRRKAKGLISDKASYDGDEWHTPIEYIEAARKAMGAIDLDPATCETAQEAIQATHFLTKQDDALLHPWFGKVWLNPPYSMPKIAQFVDKLIAEFDQGNVSEAVILVNNSSDTRWFHKLLIRFPACFTQGRIRFWHPDHKGFATRQGQVFFYLGPNWKTELFQHTFDQFGIVVGKL